MNGYFITGTSTGVGKTYVATAIARAAHIAGKRVFAFKPIETGCSKIDDELVGSDQEALCDAAGGWQVGQQRGVYRFEPPVAPSLAGPIDLDLICQVFEDGAIGADLTVVEGAGGWRVPITPQHDMSSLAKRMGLPVVLVASGSLGTINHSLLTLEAIQRDKCEIAGLVVSIQPGVSVVEAQRSACEIQVRWAGSITLLHPYETLECFT